MVAMNHDTHEHDDGEVCPGCRFRARLAEWMNRADADGRQEWHWVVGDLKTRMLAALVVLDAVEAQPFTDDDASASFEDAANAVAAVCREAEELWSLVMDEGETT